MALFLVCILCIVLFSECLLRALIEIKVSQLIERDISLDGSIGVDWHWRDTRIHLAKLSIKNNPRFNDSYMATVSEIDVTFRPLQLLRGRVDISELVIRSPKIFLERKLDESANWQFSKGERAESPADTTDQSRFTVPLIDHLQIANGHLVLNDAIKKLNFEINIDSINAANSKSQKDAVDKGYVLKGQGSMEGQPFIVEAAGGSLEALRDYSVPFPLQFKLEMGETKVLLEGQFQDPLRLVGIDALLVLEGESLADIFYLTVIPLPPTPPYTFSGRLTKNGEIWGYKKFDGRVGSSDLSGDLSYDLSGSRGSLTAELRSQVLDSADLGGFIGLTPAQERENKDKTKTIIPNVPLARERLRATDMDIRLNAAKVAAPNLPFKEMDVKFDLRDGILKLDPLKLVLADGNVDGKIEINANSEKPPMKMDLNVRQLNLRQFFSGTRFKETTDGLIGGRVSLSGEGASLSDVLASSEGELTFLMSGGKISQLLIEASDLDIGQALPLFFGKDKATSINCGVLHFDVKKGLLQSDVVVLDTNDSLLVGDVRIDLEGEKIDARLDAKPKDNSMLSLHVPITITGTLKNPQVGLDQEKTTVRGSAAIALGALLSPFTAIFALVEKGDDRDADCQALIDAVKVASYLPNE